MRNNFKGPELIPLMTENQGKYDFRIPRLSRINAAIMDVHVVACRVTRNLRTSEAKVIDWAIQFESAIWRQVCVALAASGACPNPNHKKIKNANTPTRPT
ncbi:hypothetical protein RRF57_001283 [Xylaria bambusicola]|uniref:Uncharacterized protein n=1 Tax=Xylaria bambusicola TaxID=326684 RepID=A0AAN7Z1G7_9PEZI